MYRVGGEGELQENFEKDALTTTTTIFFVLLIQNVLRHKKEIIVQKKEREHSHSEIARANLAEWLGHAEK